MEVVELIKEIYNVELSYKRVWALVRAEFGLNYSKPFSTDHKIPKNRRNELKKN